MKILKTLAKKATAAFISGVEMVGEVEKRDGVFIARYLDPINAKKWHDWAVQYGIPDPVPAAEMHVTVLASTVDVKVPRLELPIIVDTQPDYGGDAGQFLLFGPQEDVLVFTFHNWQLYHRHHALLEKGAVSKWPSYRPHLSLSTSAKGFEISDEALANVPQYIIMGPEVNADIKQPDAGEAVQDGADDAEDGDDVLIIVIDLAKTAAKTLLESDATKHELSALDAYALADIQNGRVTKGVAKRLAATEWAPPEIKDLAKAEIKKERVLKSKDVTLSVSPAVEAFIQKNTQREDTVFKADDERRLVWSIASVSTHKGSPYYDVEDDHFTTRALEDFAIQLTKSGGAGKFEHEGEACNRIVQALVLSDDLQKSLGFELEMEPLVICTEIHPDHWEEVKKGGYRDSIAGTFFYYEDEDDA